MADDESVLAEWFHAAHFGDEETLASTLSKELLDVADGDGSTALYKASARNRPGACKLLLDAGADHSIPTNAGDTPLHEASRWGYTEIVRLLVEAGASVDVVSNTGETPIGLARLNRKRKVS